MKTPRGSPFAPDLVRWLETLWEYLAVSETPQSADVIFVFGSRDLAVPARAAELYHRRFSSHVLVTGSFGRMTRDVFPKPEAHVFKDHLTKSGVPASAILTEPKASNTLENVRLGIETLRQSDRMPRTALLVAKGFVMRRCVATFAQHFGEVEVRACPPAGGMSSALDRSHTSFAERLVAEVERLDRYAARGHIRAQDVPVQVRSAAQRVTERLAT